MEKILPSHTTRKDSQSQKINRRWEPDDAYEAFELYVEGILAPTLRPGDVVVLDNLPAHRSAEAAATLKEIGAWFLFLPKYSPDLNPIEMAFSKLKALIRKVAARTYEDLWRAVGNVCSLFTPDECYNFFVAAGYDSD